MFVGPVTRVVFQGQTNTAFCRTSYWLIVKIVNIMIAVGFVTPRNAPSCWPQKYARCCVVFLAHLFAWFPTEICCVGEMVMRQRTHIRLMYIESKLAFFKDSQNVNYIREISGDRFMGLFTDAWNRGRIIEFDYPTTLNSSSATYETISSFLHLFFVFKLAPI